MNKKDNIIAIASGKGGVGKTWFTIMMAHLFARSGRNVLVFDGDIGLANIDVQLGLTPNVDLGHVFAGKSSLKDSIMCYEEGRFDIIPGRSGSGHLSNITPERLENLHVELDELAREYDHVLIDLGAGIEHYVQFLTSLASQCVVVVTDEPTSLTDAYAFIKLCRTKSSPPAIQIVINQAQTQKDGDKTYQSINKACESFLKYSPDYLGVIRKDNKVKDSIRKQQALIKTAPSTLASTDAAVISVKLMQKR
jgi:flagellar biosynthesis protein FlhG